MIKAIVALLLLCPSLAQAAEPIVSVWYRGVPAGTPRQGDLGAIRALGFNGVTWPRSHVGGVAEVRRLAALVGLTVIVADGPVALTETSALQSRTSSDRADIVVTPATAPLVLTLAWRAVAHGARTIAFDSGSPTGAGLEEKDGSLKPWVRSAIAVARQLTANAHLADIMKPGPAVTVTPPLSPAFDVVLLDADRSWVIVATNTSTKTSKTEVRLPAGAPYALWVSWLEGKPLAMVSEPGGPRWVVTMEPQSARVYIIDKAPKSSYALPRMPAVSAPCVSNPFRGSLIATISSRVLPAFLCPSTNASRAVR